MRAPSKGTGYTLEGYGRVLVKMGPSPEDRTVTFEYGPVTDPEYETLRLDDFWAKRID